MNKGFLKVRKNKIIIVIMSIITITVSMIVYKAVELKNKTNVEAVKSFIYSVNKENDMNKAKNLLILPDDTYLNDNILKSLTPKEFSNIKVTASSEDKENSKVDVKFFKGKNFGKSNFLNEEEFNVVLKDKKYYIKPNIIKDVSISVPKGASLYIDGIEVSGVEVNENKSDMKIKYNVLLNNEVKTEFKEETKYLDTYNFKNMLDIPYTIKIADKSGVIFEKDIKSLKDGFKLDNFTNKTDVKKFLNSTVDLMTNFIESAKKDVDFEELKNLFKEAKDIDTIKDNYNSLKELFNTEETKDGINITVSDFKISNMDYSDIDKIGNDTITGFIQYKFKYKESKSAGVVKLDADKTISKVALISFKIDDKGNLNLINSDNMFSLK